MKNQERVNCHIYAAAGPVHNMSIVFNAITACIRLECWMHVFFFGLLLSKVRPMRAVV